MKKNGITIEVESYQGTGVVTAMPLCVIHRALLPGHPTDSFIVEFDGRVMDPKLYPSVVSAYGTQLVHVCTTFEALVSCLAAIGMRMTWDEPEKDIPADLVDADGEAVSVCKIKAVEIREGFQTTRLTMGEKRDAEMAQETRNDGGGKCPIGLHSDGACGPAADSLLPGEDESAGESSPTTESGPAKASGLDQ